MLEKYSDEPGRPDVIDLDGNTFNVDQHNYGHHGFQNQPQESFGYSPYGSHISHMGQSLISPANDNVASDLTPADGHYPTANALGAFSNPSFALPPGASGDIQHGAQGSPNESFSGSRTGLLPASALAVRNPLERTQGILSSHMAVDSSNPRSSASDYNPYGGIRASTITDQSRSEANSSSVGRRQSKRQQDLTRRVEDMQLIIDKLQEQLLRSQPVVANQPVDARVQQLTEEVESLRAQQRTMAWELSDAPPPMYEGE